MWPQIVDGLKPIAKAYFKTASVESVTDNVVTVRIPPNMPLEKANEQAPLLTEVLRRMCGAKYSVSLVKDQTGATERPAPAPEKTIADVVAEDVYAPVDPADILPEEASDDHGLDTLREFFPEGTVEEAPPKGKKK